MRNIFVLPMAHFCIHTPEIHRELEAPEKSNVIKSYVRVRKNRLVFVALVLPRMPLFKFMQRRHKTLCS